MLNTSETDRSAVEQCLTVWLAPLPHLAVIEIIPGPPSHQSLFLRAALGLVHP